MSSIFSGFIAYFAGTAAINAIFVLGAEEPSFRAP